MTDQDTSLQVSLPQMLDLALGTPEVGAVNLNILHHFLHILLNQINLKETVVEYKGDEAARMKTIVASLKPGPPLPSIKPAKKEAQYKEEHEQTPGDNEQIEQINDRLAQVENNLSYMAEDISNLRDAYQSIPKSNDDAPPPEPTITDSPNAVPDQASAETSEDPRKSVVKSEDVKSVAESPKQAPTTRASNHRLNLGSSELNALKNDVSGLKAEVTQIKSDYGKVDTRLTQLENVVSSHHAQGIDPNQLENLEVPTASVSPPAERRSFKTEQENGSHSPHVIAPTSVPPEQVTPKTEHAMTPDESQSPTASHPTSPPAERRSTGAERRVSARFEDTPNIHEAQDPVKSPRRSTLSPETVRKIEEGAEPPIISPISSHETPARPATARQQSGPKSPIIYTQSDDPDIIRMMEALRNIEIMYGEAIHNLNNRVIDLEREMKIFNEKLRCIPCGPDAMNEIQEMVMKIRREHSKIEDNQNTENKRSSGSEKINGGETDPGIIQEIQDLVGKIQNIQSDIEQINQMAARLAEEKRHRESDTNAMLEQIELLKTIKADKEDLEDALADKADANVVKTKVSLDQFDTTRDDLARGLEDAVTKLTRQETIWQQALDDVQREIEGKLDKIEIGPIKDFVNNRLKVLQDKLKEIAEKRREHEAAGTKKMLSDVQCISCDKNVVMRIEEEANYHADPMPCSRSIKPHLTYELDQVRKQQKKLPSRDLIQFNAALQEMGRRAKLTRDDTPSKGAKDHLCNRYCGGSHTITTPHQRVMRMGHFLAQWGPDAVQLTDGAVEGNDGKLYRGRPMPPSSASRKSEIPSTPVQGERPTIPSPEASKIMASPRKSQTSQKRISSVTQVVRRSSRRVSEAIKEPIHEEPHPSPRSEPEAPIEPEKLPDGPNELPEPKSPENIEIEEDNGEDEI